jgi:glycosyltransferase involved in cell wall biosynthesis
MLNPKVSIGIPSYNHEEYISETIESILNQAFQDFEIIITDDGSSDKTLQIIKTFSDPRIKLFSFEENQGACKALNNCIINSKGEYFAYVSSDDVWEHDKLEKQVKYLDENPLTPVVFTKAKIIDENGKEFMEKDHPYFSIFDQKNRSRSKWLNRFFYKGNCICHPSIMIRKGFYDEIGFYNERMANIPDLDMWVRLCLKYNFHILDEKLTKFRVRKDEKNVSGNNPTTHIRSRFEILYLYNHYLKIGDIGFFLKIFPDAEKFGKLKPGMIPYFLARLAYESNLDVMKLWALDTLYKFMQSNEVVDQLKNNYNFGYPDFLEMSAKGDFFNVQLIQDRQVAIKRRNRALREKDLLIKEKNKESKKLNLEIENLKSNIFEIRYRNNYNRSVTQRLFSKFPSLYILFNRNNTSFKNTLINIKGYRAIKRNKMMDIGYYLKNNPDVRVSGIDPILHYMYYGFKEGRNPNPQFDGRYYLKKYSKVKNSKLNPLVHYSLFGINEGRKIQKK